MIFTNKYGDHYFIWQISAFPLCPPVCSVNMVNVSRVSAAGGHFLTPCSKVLFEKLTGSQLVKFPAFYGIRRFITAFTSARHLSLSWASSIQSIPPHPTSWSSILILYSNLRLGLPSGLFPSGFHPPKPVYTFPLHHRRYMPRPSHSSDFITRTILGEQYRSFSSSLCSSLRSPVTSSLLGPNILLSALFSNTLSRRALCNCLDVCVKLRAKHSFEKMSWFKNAWRNLVQ